MIARIIAGIFLSVLCFFPQGAMAIEYPWQLRLERDGIAVYTRRVEASPILEFKSSVIVNEPLEKVISFFEDETNLIRWYYQCVRAEVVRKNSLGERIFYFVINLGWPVKDRDCVFTQVKSLDPASGVISYNLCALPETLPRKKGKVRVLFLDATWRFTPLEGNRTEIYFQQHSNPGGSVPVFLVNRLSVEIPFHCLNNLRRMIGEIKD